MSRNPRNSSAPSRSDASSTGAGTVIPFSPGRSSGKSGQAEAGTGGFPMNPQADTSVLVDGWNFRLLV